MTNKGLEMKVDLIPIQVRNLERREVFFVELNCTAGKIAPEQYNGFFFPKESRDTYRMILLKLADPSDDVFGRILIDNDSITRISWDILTDQVIYIDMNETSRRPSKLLKKVVVVSAAEPAIQKPKRVGFDAAVLEMG